MYFYYTLFGLGPFLNNEIIQGLANVSRAQHTIKKFDYSIYAKSGGQITNQAS